MTKKQVKVPNISERREMKQKIIDKILETMRNVAAEGIISGNADGMTAMEILGNTTKALQILGVDGTNLEIVETVLNESRKVYDEVAKQHLDDVIQSNSFIDPNPSSDVH